MLHLTRNRTRTRTITLTRTRTRTLTRTLTLTLTLSLALTLTPGLSVLVARLLLVAFLEARLRGSLLGIAS